MTGHRLAEMRRAVDRDIRRLEKARPSSFLRSLALVGSVGWPIAILAAGGAVAGHFIDRRLRTGIAVTVALVLLGAAAGSYLAARTIRAHGGGA